MPLILNDRFVPIDIIGEGGFGITYLAKDLRFNGKKRALKRVANEFFLDPLILEGVFFNERRGVIILDNINYPLVPKVYAPFTVNVEVDKRQESKEGTQKQRFLFLPQEYIEGIDLRKKLNEKPESNNTFSSDEVRRVLKDILDILIAIHRKGIIHRDIKPSNIICSAEDGRYHLIDFGVVKVNDEQSNSSQDQQELFFGDDGFKPLEQWAEKQWNKAKSEDFYKSFAVSDQIKNELRSSGVAESSDLYALAVTCVSLLTGSGNPHQDFGIPLNLSNWYKNIQIKDKKLVKILNKMLQLRKSDRYQSADKVKADLDPVFPLALLAGAFSLIMISWVILPDDIRCKYLGQGCPPISSEYLPPYFSRGEEILLQPPRSECKRPEAAKASADFIDALNSKKDFSDSIQKFSDASEPLRLPDKELCPGHPELLIYANNAKALNRARDTGFPPLTIAVVIPLVQANVNYPPAIETLYGAAHAQDSFNRSQGTTSPLLQIIIVRDDRDKSQRSSDPEVARQIAQNLVDNNIPSREGVPKIDVEILGVVGHYTSDATRAASKVYKEGKLPAISPFSTAVRGDKFPLDKWHLRTSPNDAIAVKQVVDSFKELPNSFNAYIVFDSRSDYSKSALTAFKDEIESKGGTISQECDLSGGGCPELSDQEVLILLPSTQNLESIYPKVNGFNSLDDKIIMAGDAMSDAEVLRKIGNKIEGMRLGVAWHRDLITKEYAELRKDLEDLWGTTFLQWGTATTYDATQALIEAIEIASKDGLPTREKVRAALISDNFEAEGFMDSVKFDKATGERIIEGTGVGVVVEVDRADTTCTGKPASLQYCLVREND